MRDTVLLFRSGRHLLSAVAALKAAYPGHRVVVVTQPGTDAELALAGVAVDDRVVYDKGRFSPLQFLFSRAGWSALRLRLARVAVLWNDAEGKGQANVMLTALLGRRGVIPVTPEGLLPPHGWATVLFRSCVDARRLLFERLCLAWDALRSRVEGPELEPRLWHSHYLSFHFSERHMPQLASALSGLVVDIGAGTGYAGRFLSPEMSRYLPTDLPTGRDSSDRSISRGGIRPRVYCSGASLPFGDGSVDGAMAVSVLEHVKDVGPILRDAYRVLRPGGRILIAVPFCFPFHGEPNDFRRWTDEGIAAELRACGFVPETTLRLGSSVASFVLNLHLAVKYEWRTAPSVVLRAVSHWGWPLVLPWQALTNLFAVWFGRFEPESRMPVGVAIVARRPQ